jgi:putative NADPH-quinone reductase
MKTLLVFAHPLQAGSFNHALKEIAQKKLPSLQISDLYALHFKACADWKDFQLDHPPLQYSLAQKEALTKKALAQDIVQEHAKLLWCDRLILQFPLWWFSIPAILKGWLDRVFVKGFAYDKGQWFESGLMKGKLAKLVLTTQSDEGSYAPGGVHGPIDAYLKPIHHTLKLAGFSIEPPFIAFGVDGGTDALRKSYLTQYEKALISYTRSS